MDKKEKLVFLCKWGKNRSVSWSGTHYSLFNNLNKYFNVYDLDIGMNSNGLYTKFVKIKLSIYNKLSFVKKISSTKIIDKFVLKKVKKHDIVEYENVLQFETTPYIARKKQYVYQDLYWGHLKNIYYNNPELFRYSGFSKRSESDIIEKEEKQKKDYEKISGIFTMGRWMANELVKEYNISASKVYHVGGGSNIDISLVDNSKKKGNKFLFVGRDFERKNGPLVIEAFQKIYSINKSFELYIIGPERVEYDCEGIHFLGNLKYDELVYYFNICDVFCMPSKFEAYGLVFAEALIFGLPCIGRNAYEMPYFIEDGQTGYLLNDENSDELADLMLKLISNKIIKENVARKRDFYINEYSWDTVARRIHNIITNFE